MFEQFVDTKKFSVIGYGLRDTKIEGLFCDYVAEQFFFGDGDVLILCSNISEVEKIKTLFLESLRYYTSKFKVLNNAINISNQTVHIISNIDQVVIKEQYDLLFVHNNSFFKHENDFIDLLGYFKKIIVTTLDYKECIYYHTSPSLKISVQDENLEGNLRDFYSEKSFNPITEMGIKAEFIRKN